MEAYKVFNKAFSKKHLKNLYLTDVKYNCSPGIDRVNRLIFEKRIDESIEIILRKVKNNTFRFSQYRERLITKGPKRLPRVISIPTIRDKIVLKALYEVLQNVFGHQMPFLHKIVKEVSDEYNSNIYNRYLRIDVKNFYPSIRHNLLNKKIRHKIRKNECLNLIEKAITEQTVSKPQKNLTRATSGVPQGLSISGLLANIYMLELDAKHKSRTNYKYFRFVDDILILCKAEELDDIIEEIRTDISALGLEMHNIGDESSKSSVGSFPEPFEYLGYRFEGELITVRDKSKENLRASIVGAFSFYKYGKQNLLRLLWEVNLRITGCIYNKTRYGWLFYFSQINDLTLLASLDEFVKKQFIRYKIDYNKYRPKKFMRAYHEMKYNRRNTKYIPDIDSLSLNAKRNILVNTFGYNEKNLHQAEIDSIFKRMIYRTIKRLERDLAKAS